MKIQTTYSFEREDGRRLSATRAEDILGAVLGYVRTEENDEKDPHPGIKALRRIKGNVFTFEDLLAFRDYVGVLVERANERLQDLHHEKEDIAKDEASRVAYDGLIARVAEARDAASREMEEFIELFCEEAGLEMPGRSPTP